MPPIPDRLARLLAYHENAAATIRATIALLEQPDPRGPRAFSNGHSPIMHAALQVDAARREKKKEWQRAYIERKKAKTKTGPHPNAMHNQRQRTADALAHFDPTEPKLPGELPFKPEGLGRLVVHGYLKRKGLGYVRTAKPYQVNPKKKAATT